jgi:hypothetical protein
MSTKQPSPGPPPDRSAAVVWSWGGDPPSPCRWGGLAVRRPASSPSASCCGPCAYSSTADHAFLCVYGAAGARFAPFLWEASYAQGLASGAPPAPVRRGAPGGAGGKGHALARAPARWHGVGGRGRWKRPFEFLILPQANALCERLLGTLRRECLDSLLPCSANHLGHVLRQWVPHYNAGRPHMSLGSGIPQPPPPLPVPLHAHRHQLPDHLRVVTRPILGGLHHEYRLAKVA